jgi:hypothetical protein
MEACLWLRLYPVPRPRPRPPPSPPVSPTLPTPPLISLVLFTHILESLPLPLSLSLYLSLLSLPLSPAPELYAAPVPAPAFTIPIIPRAALLRGPVTLWIWP